MEVDANGRITFINEFGVRFFGYERQELLSQDIGTTILKGRAAGPNMENAKVQVSVRPEDYLLGDKEGLRKDGRRVWVNWTYTPVRDQKGNLKELLCTGLDRTDQKKNEELLVEQVKEQSAVEERSRLARDLHDAVSQTLFTSSLMAEVLPKIWKRSEEEGLKRLEDLRQLNRGALAEMRTLLYELRPASLAEVDLTELLRQLTLSVSGRSKVAVNLDADCKRDIPVEVKLALYRITQEALNNIVKHSGATHSQVTLRGGLDGVSVHIIDDGHGFDVATDGLGSFGLGNMRERASQIGAHLAIESKADEGTEVLVEWHDKTGGDGRDAREEDKNLAG